MRGWLPLAGALLATPAAASTPAAWAAGNAAVRRACIAATGLAAPSVSAPVIFSDGMGKTALAVRGRYRQAFMKGASGTFLCLYDRRSGRAEAQEAPGLALRPVAGRR